MSGVAEVWEALAAVPDPELPAVSLVDLGVISDVAVEGGTARIRFTPTYAGCPAVVQMQSAIEDAVRAIGLAPEVETAFNEPWTSDRITAGGRERLAAAGIAPPGAAPMRRGIALIPATEPPPCPHCGSSATTFENRFGPTPCRAIGWCEACRQPFEAFKPL